MCNCHCNTGINRDGSGQRTRYLQALDPAYIPVDERSIEDWLVFARRYAEQIRFYDMPASKINDPTDPKKIDWREFFRRDMAVIASSIAVTDPLLVKNTYDTARAALEQDPTPLTFAPLFGPILTILNQLDRWYTVAIPQNPLRQDMQLAIDSNLREQVKKMIAYELGLKIVDPKAVLNLDFTQIENPDLWGIHASIDPDTSIYEGATEADKLRFAALFADDIWLAFYGFMNSLVEGSDKYIRFALEQYPGHQPHMALFIAFLQIFDIARQQMNGLTAKMLDFYYKDVLQLPARPSIPDRAFVVFELAKDVTAYDLPVGTALNGGKDASGKDQVYVTGEDFVINQAKVKELKNLFIEKSVAADGKVSLEGFYARPIAKSADGFGAAFTDPTGKWSTFGKGSPYGLLSKNPCHLADQLKEELTRKDRAQVGFAIASPQLLLQGGKRLLRLRLLAGNAVATAKAPFTIVLSGEKGWLKISRLMTKAEYDLLHKYLPVGIINPDADEAGIGSSYYIEPEMGSVFIYLPVAEQAIVGFDPKIHTGADYRTSYPVMQVLLAPQASLPEGKNAFLPVNRLALEIKVGSIQPSAAKADEFIKNNPGVTLPQGPFFDGLHQLVLQNETGLLPAGKPFDPFTAYPDQGKAFYIGSAEVFNKPVDQLSVNVESARRAVVLESAKKPKTGELKAVVIPPPFAVSVLERRHWTGLVSESGNDFYANDLEKNILRVPAFGNDGEGTVVPHPLTRRPILPVTEWAAATEKGFLRISYLPEIVVNAGSTFFQNSQELAPRLKINDISLSYLSLLTALEPDIDQVFHISPFGVTETYIHPVERASSSMGLLEHEPAAYARLNALKNGLLVDAGNQLLPQFTYTSPYAVFNKPAPVAMPAPGKEKLAGAQMQVMVRSAGLDYPKVLAWGAGLQGSQQALNQYSGSIQEEGSLYIGVEKAAALENLSLLFQFAEGSADDEDDDPPPIHWSYLHYNEWKPLKGENLVSDGTFGFQVTGIVKISIPEDANDQHTIVTNGLYWFAASVTENANRIPRLIDIIAQATEVQFVDKGNAQSHFDQALAAGSIAKLVVPVDAVSKVQQPFASFDGKHAELPPEYYTRVSERLRHKGRAINAWDYEHLVLDRFPSIYKVKCIPHTDPNCLCRHVTSNADNRIARRQAGAIAAGRAEVLLDNAFRQLAGNREEEHVNTACCGPQVAPGHVLLVPVANLKNRNAVNPLQPKTSRRTLLEIEAYLQKKVSPFVHVHAKNPVYEEIIVAFRVKFYEGFDIGFYLKKLNEEIVHFLTPWAFDDKADVSFGQGIYASSVITFIEQRSYVDFITDFFMAVCRSACCPGEHDHHPAPAETPVPGTNTPAANLPEAIAKACNCEEVLHLVTGIRHFKGEIVAKPSGPRSLLVSVPQHIIIPYEAPPQLSPCEQRKKASTTQK